MGQEGMFMFGWIEWGGAQQRRGVKIGEKQVLRLNFWAASIAHTERTPAALLRRRCLSAAKHLGKLGVRYAVFPEKFPFMEEFERCGVHPADPLPLYRAMAAELARAELEERGMSPASAMVAVCGDHLSPEVTRTVTELCARYRYVTLWAGGEGAALCRKLRREYGASLVLADSPAQLERAEATVLFCPNESVSGSRLELYPGGTPPQCTLNLSGGQETPESCDRSQLFAALFASGALRPAQVEIIGKHSGA
jgi:hypothetical protein